MMKNFMSCKSTVVRVSIVAGLAMQKCKWWNCFLYHCVFIIIIIIIIILYYYYYYYINN